MARDFGGSSKTEIETEKVSLQKTWTEGVGEVQTADSTVSPTSKWDRDISKWVSSKLLLNSSGYLYLRAGLHRLARRGQGKRVTTGYCSGLVARCSLTIDVELRAGRRSQQQ